MSMSAPSVNQPEAGMQQAGRAFRGLFLFEGIALIALGFFAVLAPTVGALELTIILGWVLLMSGLISLTTTLTARQAPGFWWSLFSAVLGLVMGLALIAWPLFGAISIAMLVIVFLALEGIASIMYAVEHKRALFGSWGWMLASGILSLILAAFLLATWPATATWFLGLLVGIEMIFAGTALIRMAPPADVTISVETEGAIERQEHRHAD